MNRGYDGKTSPLQASGSDRLNLITGWPSSARSRLPDLSLEIEGSTPVRAANFDAPKNLRGHKTVDQEQRVPPQLAAS